ncbi:hypothetical protein [Clostridium estertheticum]|nr:hypothetical protein [Clostridium estertheticum]MCB2355696.1 hypothetical protein [Clostridium estertheticum]WAG39189.1 hypothetical protein LL065_12770 [Clostridium estertheticum]
MNKIFKIITISLMVCSMSIALIGCSPKSAQKVVIYTNADEEAVASMEKTLDSSGYKGKYVL